MIKVNPTLDNFYSELSDGEVLGWYSSVPIFLEATSFSG